MADGVDLGRIKGGHTTLPVNTERNGHNSMKKEERKKVESGTSKKLTQPYATH